LEEQEQVITALKSKLASHKSSNNKNTSIYLCYFNLFVESIKNKNESKADSKAYEDLHSKYKQTISEVEILEENSSKIKRPYLGDVVVESDQNESKQPEKRSRF
jgi:hypothetical protein